MAKSKSKSEETKTDDMFVKISVGAIIAVYIFVGVLTYGSFCARNDDATGPDRAMVGVGGLIVGAVWPAYWPLHWSYLAFKPSPPSPRVYCYREQSYYRCSDGSITAN